MSASRLRPPDAGPVFGRPIDAPATRVRRLLLLYLFGFAAVRAEVLIERTFLPDAHASSFAFGLPGGISFCYDPVRGGVNYAWTGGFLDITGVRPVNKLVTAAKPLGPVVFREAGEAPLRRGDLRHTPTVEFKGYTLRDASVELRYTLDGVLVREEISALPAGAGLRRRFTFDAAGADSKWCRVLPGRVPEPLEREATGAFVLEHKFRSPGS
ncbi:MAG: hypothetical protein HZA93_30210 [Verrucomicrobia bacterium]|nr:hypothetical protein [Verrucomicrobiota bacterium]